MSSQPSTSTSTQLHWPPSVTSFQEALAMIPLPPNLSAISGACERWPSVILVMLTHSFHEDRKHLQFDEDGFYTSTTDHYQTGTSKYQKVSSDDKMQNCRVHTTHVEIIMAHIFDLCAILDRLTGGSTIFMHHPGATPPGTPIIPESLNANVYINPKILIEHHELHPVVAEITQLFLSRYAAPLTQSFMLSCTNKGWRAGSSQMQMQTPTKGKGRAKTSLLPLVSPPITPSPSHFVLPDHPDGSLEVLLSSNLRILLQVTSVTWPPYHFPFILALTIYWLVLLYRLSIDRILRTVPIPHIICFLARARMFLL
ncbi:uncharacterized protein F5147DRAFT_650900 [Suillus discolor]|uniref:Uncharacterized protein n=1 Tax=Suillus discolor TaxID=1912936 RepID=A0A9P7JWC8_9AGAM|nr:uncharacterized protein F5147DRAFT_650900 [Suillus discolor]KAG2112251.1 hypothetical protein F5147DRAFT_650900 [Suillus discolor]